MPSQTEARESPVQRPARQNAPRGGVRLAVLMSRFPAVSHTFFLAEILGLRAEGFSIETASINPADRPLGELPQAEAAAALSTEYVKADFPLKALRLAGLVLRHPRVVLRGLAAALPIAEWTPAGLAWALAYVAEALLVGGWMRRRGLGHLHVHFAGPVGTVGYLVSRAWGVPYSLTVHGPNEYFDLREHRLLEKYTQAKFIFCISDFGRWNSMRILPPESWSKIHVCRLGIWPEQFPLSRPHTAEDPDGPHVLCVGRLVPDKGQRVLLEAVRQLCEEGQRLRLTLVGSGVDRVSLEAYAREHRLPVTFAGAQSHPATLERVQAADIFALPSFAEGIPVALMEAMAVGLPCISTTACGMPELIRSGEEGLLVPPGDVAALAGALRSLMVDPELRSRLGAAGRARVLADYNLKLNIPRLAAVFDQALGAIHAGREKAG